jgi:hypothetical protein
VKKPVDAASVVVYISLYSGVTQARVASGISSLLAESVDAASVVGSRFGMKPVDASRRRRCADRTLYHQDGGVPG